MHPHLLASILHASLYWLSPQAKAVIDALAAAGGRRVSPTLLARRLGMPDRHHLGRLLQREGLPPFGQLAGWTRLLAWTLAWESTRTSLSRSALEALADPAVFYRTVKHLAGVRWREVRERGTPWVLAQLRDRCRTPAAIRPAAAVRAARL